MDLKELFMQFNFTRQESSIYFTLMSEGDLNGYEVSKSTGISRSNAYSSLASLVEKGAAHAIEGAAVRYTPVPVEEICDNRIKRLQEAKETLKRNMPKKKEDVEGYVTIKGDENILNKMKTMILEAEKRVYLSVSESVFRSIRKELEAAIDKGIKLVIIVNEPLILPGAIIHHAEKSQSQIRLIADSEKVLTGDVDQGEYSTCLYSRKKNLVDLIKESLKNEILLIDMKKEQEGKVKS